MKTTWMLMGALLLAAPAAGAQASPLGLELRVRAAFPTGDFGEEGEAASRCRRAGAAPWRACSR